MLYVNTKTFNMEHKLGSERAILMWRTYWEMLLIKVREKSYSRVDISRSILKYKKGDIVCSILLSTTLQLSLSKKNWISFWILDKLKCVAKLNLALGFILKNIEDGKFRYFYAHENNTLLEQSKLVSNKDNLAKLEKVLKKTDVIESCTKERSNTKWRFFKLTNLTIFAALLRDIPMGCKDAILPESFLKNHTNNCLTFEESTRKPYNDNLCLFRALALHLHGNERHEERTSKLFNLFLISSTNPDPPKFQGVCMDDIPSVEDIVGINFFIYDIDLIDGAMVGNLHDEASKSMRRMFNCYDIIVIFVT